MHLHRAPARPTVEALLCSRHVARGDLFQEATYLIKVRVGSAKDQFLHVRKVYRGGASQYPAARGSEHRDHAAAIAWIGPALYEAALRQPFQPPGHVAGVQQHPRSQITQTQAGIW